MDSIVPESQYRMLRCIEYAIEMARWRMFNNTVVSALNYSDQLKQLEETFTELESTIDKRLMI